jgi:chromosome segregation ATPase
MAKTTNAPAKNQALAEMEELRIRYDGLSHKKTECETNLKNADKKLKDLQSQAREHFGTDDIAQLEQKLADMKAENERLVAEYRTSLDGIEADLKQVDEAYVAQAKG